MGCPTQTMGKEAGEQPHGMGAEGSGCQQVGSEPAVCSGTKKANCTLQCTRPSTASGTGRGVFPSALHSVASSPALRAGWVPQYRKDIELGESV